MLITRPSRHYTDTHRFLTLPEGRRIEPPTTWQEIDLREVRAMSPAQLGGSMKMLWGGFWIIRRRKPPLKVVYVSARKGRKF